jgi:hypothetical protein
MENKMKQIDNNRWFKLAGIAFAVVIFITTAVLVVGNKKDIDIVPINGYAPLYNQAVVLTNDNKMFEVLPDNILIEAIRKDMYVYGQNKYPKYNVEGKIIGFDLQKVYKPRTDTVEIVGKYGSSSDTIIATFKLLANERLDASIRSSGDKEGIDSYLPSNSVKNKFIASLPIVIDDSYSIGFVANPDIFVVELDEPNPETESIIISYIKTSTGSDDITEQEVYFKYPNIKSDEDFERSQLP